MLKSDERQDARMMTRPTAMEVTATKESIKVWGKGALVGYREEYWNSEGMPKGISKIIFKLSVSQDGVVLDQHFEYEKEYEEDE